MGKFYLTSWNDQLKNIKFKQPDSCTDYEHKSGLACMLNWTPLNLTPPSACSILLLYDGRPITINSHIIKQDI